MKVKIDCRFVPASALLTKPACYLHAATAWPRRSLVSSMFWSATEPLVRRVALVNVAFPEGGQSGA